MILMGFMLAKRRPILLAALLGNTVTANADPHRTARANLESVLRVYQGGTEIPLVLLQMKAVYPVQPEHTAALRVRLTAPHALRVRIQQTMLTTVMVLV